MTPDLPTDLRCEHCGELIESDRDEGNEYFRHADTGLYSCEDGNNGASDRGFRRVELWAANVGLARDEPRWLTAMTAWAKEHNVVSWSVTFGERS